MAHVVDRLASTLNSGGNSPIAEVSSAPASRIRPGVVVHEPSEAVDGLLAAFALSLRGRGFNVSGYVQRNNSGCSAPGQGCAARIEYFDLATSQTLLVERGAAVQYLRKSMREDADLLVVSRLSACIEAIDSLKAEVGSDGVLGLPLLTSIAGQCIHKWHSYARYDGAMVSPDLGALWTWWGPDHLYRDLALGVADDEVRDIVCGPRWIMVEGPYGAGVAHLPRHPRDLLPRLPRLKELGLRALANLSASWDGLETALGIASINAHYNRYDLTGQSGNGAHALRQVEGRVVVIGAFPGVDAILPHRAVIEVDPKPGEFPLAAMDMLLPDCGGAVVNSSALVNRSLPRILRLARRRPLALIGPATPLTARLHDYGAGILGGLVVRNPQGLRQAISAGVRPSDFARFGRFIHISQGMA